jgi:uncharacterized protein YdeI (YjbR/CyaY-like superfamily)
MPRYDIQKPSRSAQRLSEYQQFQQGQQAQQAAAMQQLATMYGINTSEQLLPGQLQAQRDVSRAAGTTEAMNQNTLRNQPTELEQKNRAGEVDIAFKDAQRQGVVVSTKDLEARYPYLAEKYRLENELGQTQADVAKYGLDYVLPEQARGLRLAGDAQAGENAWQQPFNEQKFALGDVEQARGRQQIQSMRAQDAYGAYDRGLVTLMQTQPWAMPPEVWQPIADVYDAKEKEREILRNTDKAVRKGGATPPAPTIDLASIPPDLQAAFAEQNAQMQAFHQEKQLREAERAALLKRAAAQHLLQQMQNADLTDFSGSYSY